MGMIVIDGVSQTPEICGISSYEEFLKDNGFKLFHAYFRLMKICNIEKDDDIKATMVPKKSSTLDNFKSVSWSSLGNLVMKPFGTLYSWAFPDKQTKNDDDDDDDDDDDSDNDDSNNNNSSSQ